jgi:hypothetical protein
VNASKPNVPWTRYLAYFGASGCLTREFIGTMLQQSCALHHCNSCSVLQQRSCETLEERAQAKGLRDHKEELVRGVLCHVVIALRRNHVLFLVRLSRSQRA